MSCRLLRIGVSLVVVCAFAFRVGAQADLPSEAMLPGQRLEKPELPPENSLPKSMQQATDSPSDRRLLPSESQLPVAMIPGAQASAEEEVADRQPEKLPPIGTRPADRPWLRLSMRGHTGMIRAITFMADGRRICSAGDDKSVEVWARAEADIVGRQWLNERTIRWQIQRGPRGRIYALASAGDLLALAGHGATGGLGEILLIDPATGDLSRALVDEDHGHRQVVVSLAFSPGRETPLLASLDIQGRALVWRQNPETGLWNSKQICAPDEEKYGAQVAKALAPNRRFAPIALPDAEYIVIPVFHAQKKLRSRPAGVPTWHLERVRIETGETQELTADRAHYEMVTALAASRDGSKLASADAFGNLFFWDLRGTPRAKFIQQRAAVVSLRFCDHGTKLLVGTARSPVLENQALIQIWDVRDTLQPKEIAKRTVPHDVWSLAATQDGSEYAYCQNNALHVADWQELTSDRQILRPKVAPITGLAFSRSPDAYRLAFGTRRDPRGEAILDQAFDLGEVQLEASGPVEQGDWGPLPDAAGGWSVRSVTSENTSEFWLYQDAARRARLPFDPRVDGAPTATCWLPDKAGAPFAVAIGTDRRNNIYVFRLADSGQARCLRQFRGHAGAVRSLAVSRDLRYLASGADDATIRLWNLAGLMTEDELGNRWGAAFQVQDGNLVASFVREDGPLYHRGVRQQDTIVSLRWHDGQRIRTVDEPQAMLQALEDVPWSTLVVFEYRRRDLREPRFQMYPAWQSLASLFVAENRDWAFWTPAGYYDASIRGHKLFGWQVNHGVTVLPEFFLAAQLRETLERPRVMRQLLKAGSLPGAFRLEQLQPPANPQNAILDEYRLKPRITIRAPAANTVVGGNDVTIRASIEVREGLQLAPPKAFANGVVASNGREVGRRAIEGGQEITYEWDARLPAEQHILIQVLAATDAEVADYQSQLVFRRERFEPPRRRLYVVAAGINEYRDAQIQRLEYAAENARTVVATLRRRAAPLYSSDATLLLNDKATRAMWNVVSEAYARRLEREASPNDLLVFFLSGHGIRDPRTQEYYYVGANADYADVKSERYEDCISFADFAAFGRVPCRKLIILDTCHSGAIQQPLRQQDLKAALRTLQDDMVLTLTASDGSQEAIEDRQRRLGRFTYRLVEALNGIADAGTQGGNADGVVTLAEVIAYVSQAVRADSARDPDSQQQYPTAGPLELLEYVRLPLAASAPARVGG
jgi:WD40 repeat protein